MFGEIFVVVRNAPLAYLGPESVMPLASILAAVVGFLLIFWRHIVRFFKKLFGKSNQAADITPYIEPDDEDQDKSNPV